MRTGIGRCLLLSVAAHGAALLAWPAFEAPPLNAGADPLPLTVHLTRVSHAVGTGSLAKPAIRRAMEERTMRAPAPDRTAERRAADPATVRAAPAAAPPARVALAAAGEAAVKSDAALPSAPPPDEPGASAAEEETGPEAIAASVRQALAAHFHYPMIARRHGWEGEVRVGLRVEADGRLTHIRVLHSSGYRLLDSAAVESLKQAGMISMDGFLDRDLELELPVRYRLIDA